MATDAYRDDTETLHGRIRELEAKIADQNATLDMLSTHVANGKHLLMHPISSWHLWRLVIRCFGAVCSAVTVGAVLLAFTHALVFGNTTMSNVWLWVFNFTFVASSASVLTYVVKRWRKTTFIAYNDDETFTVTFPCGRRMHNRWCTCEQCSRAKQRESTCAQHDSIGVTGSITEADWRDAMNHTQRIRIIHRKEVTTNVKDTDASTAEVEP